MPEDRRDSELVLPLGTYAFVLDTNKGQLSTVTGPAKLTIQTTDEMVTFDPVTPRRFKRVGSIESVQSNKIVPKGNYAILRNPATEMRFPKQGKQEDLPQDLLEIGKVVNLPGPMTFSLWPGQTVDIIPGHQLRTNDYLVVRVYDEEEAQRNWNKGTIKLVADGTDEKAAQIEGIDPKSLIIGKMMIIKGTDVSFFIPPTGVEVVRDEKEGYIRQALTLERLEYCLLADQDGNKRYERGPMVVFPKPTETFKLNDDGDRKSKAYELNDTSGLHIKVIEDYEEEAPAGVSHDDLEKAGYHVKIVRNAETPNTSSKEPKALVYNAKGEELFITGKVQTIYFPRIEHAIITYRSGELFRSRHHAIAIPAGDARYVMNRQNGVTRVVQGEAMLLPDPRTEVIIQRRLSDKECTLYYPGNSEALAYNRALKQANSDPTLASISNAAVISGASVRTGHLNPDVMQYAANMTSSRAMDTIERSNTFTPPRSLVIDPRFDGVPKINPWTGYAVQTVRANGQREVIVGPRTTPLEFDQKLEVLNFSTGTPKNHDKTVQSVYLKVSNNVTDEVEATTRDMVRVKVRVKYLIRFTDESKAKWFNVDNYVQLLTDRFRNRIGNYIQTNDVDSLLSNPSNWVEAVTIGERESADAPPPGFFFEENGMQVYGLEGVNFTITDSSIAHSVINLGIAELESSFEEKRQRAALMTVTAREESKRAILAQESLTHELMDENKMASVRRTADLNMLVADAEVDMQHKRDAAELDHITNIWEKAKVDARAELEAWDVDRQKQWNAHQMHIEALIADAKSSVDRAQAIQPHLVEALVSLAQAHAIPSIAQHLGNLAILKDKSLGGVFNELFEGTPVEGFLDKVAAIGKGRVIAGPSGD